MRYKFILYLVVLSAGLSFAVAGNAQLYNTGQLFIDSTTALYSKDTLHNKASGQLVIKGVVSAGGVFINNASITGKGKVILRGAAQQNVLGTGTISNLEVNTAGATIVPGNMQTVADTLTITAGTLTTNGGLTLKSTAVNTARVAPIMAGSVSGDVIVERYIPDDGHRAWRLLSVSTTGPQTIRDAWQEGGRSIADSGTLVTSNLYSASNGFDMRSNSASILIHDQGGASTGPSWTTIPVTNTNAVRLDSRTGYMLFVRGDRTATPSNSLHNATTMRSTGSLRQGNQPAVTVSATGTGYTLVGNPYASPIDFESIAATPNLSQSFYIWDANLSGLYGVGGFRTVERLSANTYQQTPQAAGGTLNDNSLRYIHSGQAFFLKASGANASVVFTEASKTTGVSSINPFRQTSTQPQLLANLMVVTAGNTATLADGIRVRFDKSYSAAVTAEDVTKMSNFADNLASKRDNKLLIVEKRPEVNENDTIFLNMANAGIKNYRLEISGINMPSTLMAYLVDNYLNAQTTIDLNSITNIDFSVKAEPASAAADRFKIVLKTATILPVTLTYVKAYQQGSNITVEWKVQNETAIKQYEVEKSMDGISFVKAAIQSATGNNASTVTYNWLDATAETGNNFYRIKSIGLNGEGKYSAIVKVIIGKGKAGYQVYPNPITRNVVNLQLINQAKGMYEIRLLNNLGQVMLSRQILHEQGSSAEAIELNHSIAKGQYILEVTAPDKSKRSIKIIY